MIVRAIDGRYLNHPFFCSIEEELPWQRLSPASKFIQSSCQSFGIQKLKHEVVTGKQNCKLFSSAGLRPQTNVELQRPVGAPHSLCRAPTLCVGAQRSLCRGPALLCVGLPTPIHVPPPMRGPRLLRVPPPIRPARLCGPPAPRATHPAPRAPSYGPAQIRVPPIQPGVLPFVRREPQTLLFGGQH